MDQDIVYADTPNTVYINAPLREKKLEMVHPSTIAKFDYAFDPKRPFFKRVGRFLKGQNELGRKVGGILDLVTLFLPGYIRTGREAVQIITQKQNTAMKILNDKAWYESKSVWSAVLFVITGVLQALGVDFEANAELVDAVYMLLYHIAGALGFVGIRAAIGDRNKPQQ